MLLSYVPSLPMRTATTSERTIKCSRSSPPRPRRRTWGVTVCAANERSTERDNINTNIDLNRRTFLASAATALSASIPGISAASANTLWNPRAHNVLYDSSSGSFIPASSLGPLLDRYCGSLYDRCIIVGEIHDHVRTHAAQLNVLQTAKNMDDGRPLIVGFEQFYRAHTPFLQDYVRGDISLSKLLSLTQWNSTWGYPVDLYAPLFQWCRVNNVQMVGLNVPRKFVSFVSEFGLTGLSPELKAFLPPNMDVENSDHFSQFLRLLGMSGHAPSENMRSTVRRWFEAQVTWDEYMAESVRQSCEKHPDARFVALIGSGHVEERLGFPNRIEKRLEERPLTIVPREVRWISEAGFPMPDIDQPERNLADIVWYTNRSIDMA